MTETISPKLTRNVTLLVLVASLGYFVDIYDLLVFLIVRNDSLKDVGVQQKDLFNVGISILNWQMAGLLVGCIFWEVWGAQLGRSKFPLVP